MKRRSSSAPPAGHAQSINASTPPRARAIKPVHVAFMSKVFLDFEGGVVRCGSKISKNPVKAQKPFSSFMIRLDFDEVKRLFLTEGRGGPVRFRPILPGDTCAACKRMADTICRKMWVMTSAQPQATLWQACGLLRHRQVFDSAGNNEDPKSSGKRYAARVLPGRGCSAQGSLLVRAQVSSGVCAGQSLPVFRLLFSPGYGRRRCRSYALHPKPVADV